MVLLGQRVRIEEITECRRVQEHRHPAFGKQPEGDVGDLHRRNGIKQVRLDRRCPEQIAGAAQPAMVEQRAERVSPYVLDARNVGDFVVGPYEGSIGDDPVGLVVAADRRQPTRERAGQKEVVVVMDGEERAGHRLESGPPRLEDTRRLELDEEDVRTRPELPDQPGIEPVAVAYDDRPRLHAFLGDNVIDRTHQKIGALLLAHGRNDDVDRRKHSARAL